MESNNPGPTSAPGGKRPASTRPSAAIARMNLRIADSSGSEDESELEEAPKKKAKGAAKSTPAVPEASSHFLRVESPLPKSAIDSKLSRLNDQLADHEKTVEELRLDLLRDVTARVRAEQAVKQTTESADKSRKAYHNALLLRSDMWAEKTKVVALKTEREGLCKRIDEIDKEFGEGGSTS